MTNIENNEYNGFVVLSINKKPLAVISCNADKQALLNKQGIPNKFKTYLIAIEDQRFYNHGAIDIKAITRAFYQNIKVRKFIQGGSTITQQLARNLLKENKKTIIRKLKEIAKAISLESKHTKNEILELYFAEIFFGRRNYGLRSASLEYFSKEPNRLNITEQLFLLTILRGPNYYLNNINELNKRIELISNILVKKSLLSQNQISKLKKTTLKLSGKQLGIFKNTTLPYIIKSISKKTHSIITTLVEELQLYASNYVSKCKYPTSVIIISNGNVIAVESTYGPDFAFNFKSNVGSTLKPIIYSFLRENGINSTDLFTTSSAIDWNIREANHLNKKSMTLKDALMISNNNVFVNATHKIGIEKVMDFLSQKTNKPLNNFVPSSILGATVEGLSLYELVDLYYRFFLQEKTNEIKKECLSILNLIAKEKFNNEITNAFLKTGTTNLNKERFGIVGLGNTFFGFLRQGNEVNDDTKDGGFIAGIIDFLKGIIDKNYKWI